MRLHFGASALFAAEIVDGLFTSLEGYDLRASEDVDDLEQMSVQGSEPDDALALDAAGGVGGAGELFEGSEGLEVGEPAADVGEDEFSGVVGVDELVDLADGGEEELLVNTGVEEGVVGEDDGATASGEDAGTSLGRERWGRWGIARLGGIHDDRCL